jgi:hypothetical protein
LLSDHPEYTHVSIEGHADARGPETYNQQLSERRAESVMKFLVKNGIEDGRLSSKGFGSSKPLVDKKSEYAWLLNRRVEFMVTREVKATQRSGGPEQRGQEPGQEPAEAVPAEPDGSAAPPAKEAP